VPREEVADEASARWRAWYARWDRFQESYVPDREAQFGLMLDYVALWWRNGAVRALDLASGPGCVADRLLRRLPDAEVAAVDCDPWLLEMGRRALADAGRVEWVDADLREEGWTRRLPHPAYEAVLTTTALHWLSGDEVKRTYRALAEVVVPDGLFLNADIMPTGSPTVGGLARSALERWRAQRAAGPDGEHWQTFWGGAGQVPEFRDLLAERARRLGPRRPLRPLSLEFHRDALLEAGFREVGEIWRRHETAILLAIR
jgi:SAM-dependent methyltransferase